MTDGCLREWHRIWFLPTRDPDLNTGPLFPSPASAPTVVDALSPHPGWLVLIGPGARTGANAGQVSRGSPGGSTWSRTWSCPDLQRRGQQHTGAPSRRFGPSSPEPGSLTRTRTPVFHHHEQHFPHSHNAPDDDFCTSNSSSPSPACWPGHSSPFPPPFAATSR